MSFTLLDCMHVTNNRKVDKGERHPEQVSQDKLSRYIRFGCRQFNNEVQRLGKQKGGSLGIQIERIANFIVETSYEQLPPEAVNIAKRSILDCLGCALAGSEEDTSKIVNDYVRAEEGKPEAGVIGGSFKTTAPQAAWANGTKAHALDYDDVAFPLHPTVAILPGLLAVGEKFHLSGKDVLLAYITAFEVEARLREVELPHVEQGWHVTSTSGSIGAAAAVAKMLGLEAEKVRMALGIAASLAGGLRKNFGTMTKPLHAGNAARNGVVAAMLAQKGFTADENIFSGPLGFCRVLGGGADYDEVKLSQELGTDFHIVSPGIGLKLHPSCAATHWALDAAAFLRKEYAINAADIDEVECRTSAGAPKILFHSRPKTALEGKFSLEFCVAIAFLDGQATLREFTDEKVKDSAVQEFMKRVKYVHPPEMGVLLIPQEVCRGEMVVKLRDGKTYSSKVDVAKGEPQNPLNREEVSSKYWACVCPPLSSRDAEHSINLISGLESVEDITQLMDIFTFKGSG
jgi:2-methylcitrate dehydratase PrpD